MYILQIVLASISSIIVLFILTKIMGYRQMSQLSMFDYINGITIGSIAAELATALDGDFIEPLIAMIIYTVIVVLFSYLSDKSIFLRRIISGTPLILLDNNKIYHKNFKKSKIDANEFIIQCRVNGYFDLSNIQTAILEANGKISFIPVSSQRPLTPNDIGIQVNQEHILATVIIDGAVMKSNLKGINKDEEWLYSQLENQGIISIKNVFLATCSSNNILNVYIKLDENREKKRTIIE